MSGQEVSGHKTVQTWVAASTRCGRVRVRRYESTQEEALDWSISYEKYI